MLGRLGVGAGGGPERGLRTALQQRRFRKSRAVGKTRPPIPDSFEEALAKWGKPTYSRSRFEHLAGFDHWRKWSNYRDEIPAFRETAASPIWPPFDGPRRAEPEIGPGDVPFNALPSPSNEALRLSHVHPSSILEDKAHLIHPASPIAHPDYFDLRPLIRVSDMMRARLHLGHKVGTLHDRMRPFVFGERLGTCVLDLDQTKEMLFKALNFLAHMAYREAVILLVTQRRGQQRLVEQTARRCGEFAHTRRWVPGTLTDSENKFRTVVRLPDVLFLASCQAPLNETHPGIVEAAKMSIPTVGIVDSDSDPTYITYPIPANDDSPQAVLYLLDLLHKALSRAKAQRHKDQQHTSL